MLSSHMFFLWVIEVSPHCKFALNKFAPTTTSSPRHHCAFLIFEVSLL